MGSIPGLAHCINNLALPQAIGSVAQNHGHALAVVWAGSCGCDSALGLGTSICSRYGLKSKKKDSNQHLRTLVPRIRVFEQDSKLEEDGGGCTEEVFVPKPWGGG